MLLPDKIDAQYFDREFRLRSDLWKDRILDLAREKNIPTNDFHPFPDGSNLVASLGNRFIIKVFPAKHRHQWVSDHRVLRFLQGRLKTTIPAFIDAGEIEFSWTYLIMSKIAGESYERVWPSLNNSAKAQVLFQIGTIMREVHSLPLGPIQDLPPSWPDFLRKQIDLCESRHRRLGMPDWFTDGLRDFLDESLLTQDFCPVLLTGEYTPFNLLGDPSNPEKLIGMIDFGDAMVGPAEYDLLGPSLFLCEGKRDLFLALLRGYGIAENDFDASFRRRLFALQILHRYSDFESQVRIPGWLQRIDSREDLEKLIWPLPGES